MVVGIIQNTFEGALTDNSALLKSKKSCKTVLCDPIWVIPLPIPDDVIYLEIAVEDSPEILFSVPLK